MASPSNNYELVDQLSRRWHRTICPLYVRNYHSQTAFQSIGTAFLLRYRGAIFFCSAHHAIKEIQNADSIHTEIDGKVINLSGTYFRGSSDTDVAVAHLNHNWMTKRSLTRCAAISFPETVTTVRERGLYFLMGFPSTKNKINSAFGKSDQKVYTYSLTEPRVAKGSTSLTDYLAFEFDVKSMNDSYGASANPPKLNGMSGCPIFEVVTRVKNDFTIQQGVELVGVFCEWSKSHRELRGANIEALKEALDLWCREI